MRLNMRLRLFFLAVFLAALMVPFVSAIITYDAVGNTINVNGTNGGVPWGFWDLWNASNVNGWGIISNNDGNNYQFEFDAKIVIGDDVTPTLFNDTEKQIVFLNGIVTGTYQSFIKVKAGAVFTLGTLVNLTERTTRDGCDILILETSYSNSLVIGGSGSTEKIYLYDTVVRDIKAVNPSFAVSSVGSNGNRNLRIINCEFIGSNGPSASWYDIIYGLRVASAKYGIINSNGNLLDGLVLEELYLWDIYQSSPTADMVAYNVLSKTQIDAEEVFLQNPRNLYFINCDLFWDSLSLGYSGYLGKFYRQYTWNTLIKDDAGLPIHNANVTLIREDDTWFFSVLTAADGTIVEQTISRGFYNQTGGNTMYDYGPFTLQVTATNYLPHSIFNITLTEPINWEIALTPPTPYPMFRIIMLPIAIFAILTLALSRRYR